MTSSGSPHEPSPRNTYRLMAGMASAAIVLIGVIIYSLSHINNSTWTAPLRDVDLLAQSTLRQELPHFEYTDEGKMLTAQNFEGKWTLLTFWAYWCAPCLEELPTLNQLSQQWQGPEFEILTVNVDADNTENIESSKKFLSDEEIALPTLFDKTGDLKKKFNVSALPQHFLISPDKKIVWQATGAYKWNETNARDQLMKVMERGSADSQDAMSVPDPNATEVPLDSEPELAK